MVEYDSHVASALELRAFVDSQSLVCRNELLRQNGNLAMICRSHFLLSSVVDLKHSYSYSQSHRRSHIVLCCYHRARTTIPYDEALGIPLLY